jgi:hypothetical protein
MSGLMNLVNRVARGAAATGRRPHARPVGHRPAGRGPGGAMRGRGTPTNIEGAARRLLRRAR